MLKVYLSVLANQKTASIPANTNSPQDTRAWVIDHGEFESGSTGLETPLVDQEPMEIKLPRYKFTWGISI